jgi:hypothetical protein
MTQISHPIRPTAPPMESTMVRLIQMGMNNGPLPPLQCRWDWGEMQNCHTIFMVGTLTMRPLSALPQPRIATEPTGTIDPPGKYIAKALSSAAQGGLRPKKFIAFTPSHVNLAMVCKFISRTHPTSCKIIALTNRVS